MSNASAASLNLDVDSDTVEHVATMRLARRTVLARMLRNDMLRTDPDALLKLDAALKPYQPPVQSPQISVQFVESVQGTFKCSHCGERNEVKSGEYTPATRRPFQYRCECGRGSEISVDGPFTDGGDPGKPVAAPEPAATPNGVTYREGVSGSAFYAAVLRNNEIPPLKKEQPAIGAHVSPSDTVAGLWRNDRHPYRNRDVAHQLPAVNGKG
jgi:hypothetical protein